MSTTASQQAADGNRVSLIKAAADAFAEFGYEGASLRSIAEGAGVSYQLISHYFGSKEDLWRATLEYLFERYLETGNGLGFDLTGNVRLQFRNHLRFLLTDMLQRPQIRKIWTQEYFAASNRYTQSVEPQIETLLAELALPYYREVIRLGIVEKFTAEEMSVVIGAILHLNVVYPYPAEIAFGIGTGSAKSINRQVDLLFDMLTDDAESSPAPQPGGTAVVANENAAPRDGEQLPGSSRGAGIVSDSTRDDHEIARLRAENTDLKKVLAELLVQKAALHGKLRAVT